jgi:hypothetical protein
MLSLQNAKSGSATKKFPPGWLLGIRLITFPGLGLESHGSGLAILLVNAEEPGVRNCDALQFAIFSCFHYRQ